MQPEKGMQKQASNVCVESTLCVYAVYLYRHTHRDTDTTIDVSTLLCHVRDVESHTNSNTVFAEGHLLLIECCEDTPLKHKLPIFFHPPFYLSM